MKRKSLKSENISLGVCYYPEHWNESLWESDLNRMKKVGINTVRIAEFAWNIFEPSEGKFQFDFFDRFLDLTEKLDVKVIFGTPSATPPAWLTEKYPEALNCDMDGIPYRHGARRHYNYNSPKYRELCCRIVEKIAEHYAGRKTVIGWQIDNELNCETDVFYSESDTVAFRKFLKDKYKTLDELNKRWGTVFWNQTYTDWEELHVPRKTLNNSTNPHELLDYKRFVSASTISFAKMQADIIRRYTKKGDFVTTNGIFGNIDNHKFTDEVLDFMMYDSYPNFAYDTEYVDGNDKLRDRKWGRNLSEVRAVSPEFGVMEQQSGANGWTSRMLFPAPKPGQMLLWTMQSIAHGANYISFFRWRTSTMGNEIYWHGILDYDNRDNRKLSEVEKIHNITDKLDGVGSASYKAEFAVLRDYDNKFDSEVDAWHGKIEWSSYSAIFEAAQNLHAPMDYLYLCDSVEIDDLKKYKVLFYLHALILKDRDVRLLKEYVKQGGILILGCRTGLKDESGRCPMHILPGAAADLAGVQVEESTFADPRDGKVFTEWDGEKIETAVYNDILEPVGENSKVLGCYDANYYKGKPALIMNNYGKGTVYSFGGAFSVGAAECFIKKLGLAEPFEGIITLSKECEIAVREGANGKYLFVLNYSSENSRVYLKKAVFDMTEDKEVSGDISIEGYGVKIFKV